MKLDDAVFHRAGAQLLSVRGQRAGTAFQQDRWVAEEVPIALQYNGISHAVMLASPLDLEDFALGFSISEGLIDDANEVYGIDELVGDLGITLEIDIASAAFSRLKSRRRSLAGRTGCGLCGTDSLSQVLRPMNPLPRGKVIEPKAIARAMSELAALQTLNHATGAVHAAAWCTAEGDVRSLREDVGRHNALDKLTGSLVRERIDPEARNQGFIAVTSRASVEMVQKVACANVSLLAAVSAPTTLAVQVAMQVGLTLVGFARGADLAVYSHAERLGFA